MEQNVVTKWDSFSTKKLSQGGTGLLKNGTAFLFQSGTEVVTKLDRCYKVGQVSQQTRSQCMSARRTSLRQYFLR